MIELRKITTDMVEQFFVLLKQKHNLAPKTINNIRSIFLIMLEEAVKEKIIEVNPVKNTLCRTVDKRKQELLTDAECQRLFDENKIDELWNGNLCYFCYSLVSGLTGLRSGELLALTITDIEPYCIHVKKSYSQKYGIGTTKNSEERSIPISKAIYQVMYATFYSHPTTKSAYIFSNNGEKPMSATRARLALYSAMNKIGITDAERKRRNITFHSWRHKFTTECVKSNMHPEKIKMLTGHKSIEMITRYTDLSNEDLSSQVIKIQEEHLKKSKE